MMNFVFKMMNLYHNVIPDSYFATAGADGLVKWWRLREGFIAPERADGVAEAVTAADVAGGAVAPQLLVEMFELAGEIELASVLPLPTHCRALAYSKGASTLAISTTTSEILLLGLSPTLVRTSLQLVAQGHHGPVYGLATHPTLPYYVTSSDDSTIRLWSAESHQCLAGKTLRAAAHHLDFSADGRYKS